MANTVIQLKHSTVQGNVPVSLANGEISINTRDGKIFYADPTGTIQEFSEFPGPAGLNGEIQFNDSGVLGSDSGLTYNKTTDALTVAGQIFGSTLKSTQSSGDEGGQLDLATAATNSSLAGGSVNIDIYQNKLRIFEAGGTNRGVYIDIANGASSGVGTDLLNPGSTPDTVARNQATAAFIRANNSLDANNGGTVTGNVFISANLVATNVATQTYIQFGDGTKQYTANSGSGTGSAAKITLAATPPSNNANGDIWISSTSGKKFTWFTDEDSAQWVEFGPNGIKGDPGDLSNANLAFNAANSAFIQANAAFLAANNATDTYVRNHANSAFIQANAAFIQANSATTVARSYALGMFLY